MRLNPITLLAIWHCLSAVADASATLPLPAEENSLETASRQVGSIIPLASGLIILPLDRSGIYVRNFDEEKKHSKNPFGSLRTSRFADLKPITGNHQWVSAILSGNKLILFDRAELRLQSLAWPDLSPILTGSIIADLIKPPADSRGEPPQIEIQETRSRFIRTMRKSQQDLVTSVTQVPKTWRLADDDHYFITTRLQEFPLLLAACRANTTPSCTILRYCRLEGKKLNTSAIIGIATDARTRNLLLVDRQAHALHHFKFESCFHIPYQRTIRIPARIKEPTSAAIDDQGRLWISTRYPDDYFNASVFLWDRETWNHAIGSSSH